MIEYEDLSAVNRPFVEEFHQALDLVLDSGRYILGQAVQRFEKEFSDYTGSRYCSGVANGLDALVLSLDVLGLRPGDEVIVPSNTYIATILSVLRNGLRPVLVEPDIRTYTIDPARIEAALTPRTRVLMVVHLYGKVCNMDPILSIAGKHDLKIIEDCAQAHGAAYKNIRAGNFGDFGAFSFYPTKNLGALGDGGALTTPHKDMYDRINSYRNYGSSVKYYNEYIGYNSRLDELQAAFLSIKLKRLDQIIAHKRKLAQLYETGLKEDFIKPVMDPDNFDVYHIYSIRHTRRDDLRRYLLKNDIKTEIHYPVAPNRQLAMKGWLDGTETPIAEEIHQTTLSLPISYGHQEGEIHRVIEVLNRF